MGITEKEKLPHYFKEDALSAKAWSSRKPSEDKHQVFRSDFNQIWHFFNLLYSQKRQLYCFYNNQKHNARISELRKKDLILQLETFIVEDNIPESIEIEFVHSGNVYQFDMVVKLVWQKYVCIEIPAYLQSKIIRNGLRIIADDLYLHFTLAYPPFPLTPFPDILATDLYSHSHMAPIIEEIQKDEPNINLLCIMVADILKGLNFTFRFEMYTDNHQPNELQELMIDKQKTAFIRDTRNLDSYTTAYSSPRLVNFCESYADMKEQSEEQAKAYCQKLQQKDADEFLRSYAYAPLFLFGTAIGHLAIFSKVFDSSIIFEQEALIVDNLARFLSYAISKATVTKTYYKESYTRILNISKSGMLIEVNGKRLLDYLLSQKYLKLSLQVRNDFF